ncbi:MAG: hypothetical protein H6Q70_1087 [Firmicutes bacterium]|nr:hypothetical protein [Bacillota bacterium]
MDSSKKCVAVIDQDLPIGIIANTAAILGCTLGKQIQEIVGEDVVDQDKRQHLGIINTPLPILAASKDQIKEIYQTANEEYEESMMLVGFSDLAQRSKSYEDYTKKMAGTLADNLNYLGICLYGDKKEINHLTGSLPTLK